MKKRIMAAALAAAFGLTSTLADAAVVTSSTNVAPAGGAAHDTYDPATDTPGSGPMMSASSTDLAEGVIATFTSGGGSDPYYEFSTGETAWTDGSIATVYPENGPSGDAIDHAAYGSVDNGFVATWDLGGIYDLTQIDVFGGWNDSGRDGFDFEVLLSSDDVTYTSLISVAGATNDTGSITVPVTHLHSITDVATSARYVRLTASNVDNGHAGLVEVDIYGVPEPGTIALAGLGMLACAALRRRS